MASFSNLVISKGINFKLKSSTKTTILVEFIFDSYRLKWTPYRRIYLKKYSIWHKEFFLISQFEFCIRRLLAIRRDITSTACASMYHRKLRVLRKECFPIAKMWKNRFFEKFTSLGQHKTLSKSFEIKSLHVEKKWDQRSFEIISTANVYLVTWHTPWYQKR